MKVISEINGSGLYAQSALSASTASYDSLGNEITATYATKSEIPSLDGYLKGSDLKKTAQGTFISAISGTELRASRAVQDELGHNIINTYATKSEIPSLDGLMETDKLEFDSNNKITAYNGSAFAGQGGIAEVVTSEPITGNGTAESPIGAETIEIESINLEAGEGIDITDGVISVTGGQGGSTYTTDDTEYLNIDNTDSKINFTDKTKQAIDNVPTGTNYDLVGGENIKFTVDDTEHQIVIDVEAPLSTYQIFEYGTASAQQTIDCWKEGKIPVLRIPGYSALLWPCRLPTVDPTTLTTAQYQYFGCNYNASAFTAYLYSTNSRASGLFTACNQSTYTSYTANANKWLSAVSAQSANWNTVSSLSADKEDKITFGYNDGKIVSMNGSALSAGSNYEGISPIVVDNEAKTIGANTRSVAMQTFSHDDSLVHIESDEEYALGVNVQYFSPEYGKEKFCGYWNGKPLYHRLYSGTFETSNGSYQTQDVITTDLSTAYTFQCVDPQNSFIWYAGAAKIPAVSWCLGENRYGGSVISKNQGFYRVECRGVDDAAHQCSAYICFRYTKEPI